VKKCVSDCEIGALNTIFCDKVCVPVTVTLVYSIQPYVIKCVSDCEIGVLNTTFLIKLSFKSLHICPVLMNLYYDIYCLINPSIA
jgi:hypothetical protein